jgi:hypothetical protein
VSLGIRDAPLSEALLNEPFVRDVENDELEKIIIHIDTDDVGAYRQRDMPISFSQGHRKFAYRYIKVDVGIAGYKTEHDAFERVGE